MPSNVLRELYEAYAGAVAYVTVKTPEGNETIGTAFHIGQGVFISARHVFENNQILSIATTESTRKQKEVLADEGVALYETVYFPEEARTIRGPYFHPNPKVDVAAVVIEGINAPIISLGDHLDDWLGTELVLSEVLILGYPSIPFSREPTLIAARAEVNAIIDKYTGGHPHFILSAMARGGFSGGPAITTYGFTLGIITESLLLNHNIAELGYMSVLSVEPIYTCLSYHNLIPDHIDKQWDGFWNTTSFEYIDESAPSGFQNVSIAYYRGHMGKYINLYCHNPNLMQQALDTAIVGFASDKYSIEIIHDKMNKVRFTSELSEEELIERCKTVRKIFEEAGLKILFVPQY